MTRKSIATASINRESATALIAADAYGSLRLIEASDS